MENDLIVEAIEEFRPEMAPESFIHPSLHSHVLLGIAGKLQDRLAADVAGENKHSVGEVHGAALPIGDAAVIEDLQHHVENIRVGFLDLVEQDHGVGPTTHRFGELATGLISHVAGRRSDQTTDGVLFHVLRHVDANHGVIAFEQPVGERFGEFCFADTGGAKKEEAGDGAIRVAQASPGPLNRIRDGGDCLMLADHPLMQVILQMQQLCHFALYQPRHGDTGPLGDYLGDVVFTYLLPQQAFLARLLRGDLGFLLE